LNFIVIRFMKLLSLSRDLSCLCGAAPKFRCYIQLVCLYYEELRNEG
jgi:hypothetical protein